MNYSEITPYIRELAGLSDNNNHIVPEMYAQYDVKRGLRDINGNGVVAGLTEVSRIKAKDKDADGNEIPCEGQLYYRGINVRNIVKGFLDDDRPGFEETVYLLLFSKLPNKEELERFCNQLSAYRSLPPSFVRDMILKAPGKDVICKTETNRHYYRKHRKEEEQNKIRSYHDVRRFGLFDTIPQLTLLLGNFQGLCGSVVCICHFL